MPDVRWSRGAVADLDALGAYVERSSPAYARALVGRLFAATDALHDHPSLGRVVPEVEVSHVREILRDGYRIVYVVSDDLVAILAVLHGRQDRHRALRREGRRP